MKKTNLIIIIILTIINCSAQQIISTNTVWNGNIFLSQKVIVQPGVTLTIDSGTIIYTGYIDVNSDNIGDVELVVNGKLVVNGNLGCNKVKFMPFLQTTNKKHWTGITIRSNVTNDSINGLELYNADTALSIYSNTTITSVNIQNFGSYGICFKPINSNTKLNVYTSKIKNGKNAIYSDNLDSKINLDWVLIDSCTNGVFNKNGVSDISSSIIINSTRLGIANMDGVMKISNCIIKNNYAFGIVNSSGNIGVYNCIIDSNVLGGILNSGTGENIVNNSNIRFNKGTQIEVTNYKFDLNMDGPYYPAQEYTPRVMINNNNILGDTLSTFFDSDGLFQAAGGGSSSGSFTALTPAQINNYANSVNGFRQTAGRVTNYWLPRQLTMAGPITSYTTQIVDLYNGFAGCTCFGANACCVGMVKQILMNETRNSNFYCYQNDQYSGIFTLAPTFNVAKSIALYITRNSNGGIPQLHYIFDNNYKSFSLFGGKLISNSCDTGTLDFSNNNFGQANLPTFFFDNCNGINYSAFTIFPKTSAGINLGQQLLDKYDFPNGYLKTINNSDTICLGGINAAQLIAPMLAGANYNWYYNGSLFQTTTSNLFTVPVQGAWSCIVVGSNCTIKTNARKLIISSAPIVNITGSLTVCLGKSTILTATGATNYVWSNNATSNSIILNPLTSDSIKVTGYANGCSASKSNFLLVNPLPTLTISPFPSAVICQGANLNITASGNGRFTWSNGDSSNISTINSAGKYAVTLIDLNGCSKTSDSLLVLALPKPNASISFTGPLTVCKGGTVNLINNSANYSSFSWIKNNTFYSSGTINSIDVNQSGNYKVVATGSNGCLDTSSEISVRINSLPIVNINSTLRSGVCQGDSNTLFINNRGLSVNWYRNGLILANANTYHLKTNEAGNYFTVFTDSNNCSSRSDTFTNIINPKPNSIITKSKSAELCQGDSIELFSFAPGTISKNWLKNGISTSNTTSSIVCKQTGNYQLVLINDFGCKDTSEITKVNINQYPIGYISYDKNIVCEGYRINLLANGSDSVSYQWQLNNTPISGANSIGYEASLTGNYSVRLTSLNGSCNTMLTPVFIKINSNPIVTSRLLNQINLCEGDTGIITTDSIKGYQYQWIKDFVGLSGQNQYKLKASKNGAYSVQVIDSNGCVGTSNITNIYFSIKYPISITASGPTTICPGSSILLTAQTAPGREYSWYKDGQLLINTINNTYNASLTGIYTAKSGSSTDNCILTSNGISVIKAPGISLSTIMGANSVKLFDTSNYSVNSSTSANYLWTVINGNVINGNGTNTISILWNKTGQGNISVVGTTPENCTDSKNLQISISNNTAENEIENNKYFEIFPNPNNGKFSIVLNSEKNTQSKEISIYNSLGEVVYKKFVLNQSYPLNISLENKFSDGIYFIEIIFNNSIYRKKLIVHNK
jgi:hypothetical protein